MQQFLFLQSAVQICLRGVAGRRGQGPGRLRPEVGWRCYEHGSASFPRPKAKSSGLASAILQSLVRPDRVVFDGPMEQSFGKIICVVPFGSSCPDGVASGTLE